MTPRRLLLAGSHGIERIPARPDPEHADWYLPLHLRDERAARERIAVQVAAGADVVVAPTWLTHRRALLPLGETRRAATWSAAAVRIAREAVEIGLDRREERATQAADAALARARPTPLVAATLPALDEEPEPGTGRLMPPEAATVRDYRDQAGILADALPDLILVEGQRSEAGARMAMTQAAETGVRTWAALTRAALDAGGLDAWLEWASAAQLDRLLLPPAVDDRLPLVEADMRWGVVLRSTDMVKAAIEAGAGTLALIDGAMGATLEPVRAAIDACERAELEIEQARQQRWMAHVGRAAGMAGGGAAAWVGPPADGTLPARFDWLVLDAREARQLPLEHFRLVVAAGDEVTSLAAVLEPGGLLAARASAGGTPADLQLVLLDEDDDPALALYRREQR